MPNTTSRPARAASAPASTLCQNCRCGRYLVVRRHHQHQAVAEFGQGAQRRQRHRRGGVAPRGLEQRTAAGEIEAGKVGMDALGMALGGDQEDRRLAGRPRRQPAQGLGQHRAVARKIVKLLGIVLARQRPEPRADAAAHDETDDALAHARVSSKIWSRAAPISSTRRLVRPIIRLLNPKPSGEASESKEMRQKCCHCRLQE